MQILDIFRANIVDVAFDSIIVEVSGDEEKVDSLVSLMRGFGVAEVMRTGTIAMNRGQNNISARSNKIVETTVYDEATSV